MRLPVQLTAIAERRNADRFLLHANNPRLPMPARRLAATLASQARRAAQLWDQSSTTVNHGQRP